MAGSPKKRERRDRLQALIAQDDTPDWLCARIASGQNLVEICRELDVPYVAINEWIQEDEERRKQYKEALEIRDSHSKELVIRELTGLLSADLSEAFNADGSLKPFDQIPENVRRCIAGFELSEIWGMAEDEHNAGEEVRTIVGHLKKIKFFDKMKATELLARTLKMLTDKTEHTGKDGGPIQVMTVRYPQRLPAEAWAEKHKPKEITDGGEGAK